MRFEPQNISKKEVSAEGILTRAQCDLWLGGPAVRRRTGSFNPTLSCLPHLGLSVTPKLFTSGLGNLLQLSLLSQPASEQST